MRQLQCLFWVQQGKSANDIGVILGVSGRTIEGHLARVCAAMGVRTRVQAVVRAKDLGVLPCGDAVRSLTWLVGELEEGAVAGAPAGEADRRRRSGPDPRAGA